MWWIDERITNFMRRTTYTPFHLHCWVAIGRSILFVSSLLCMLSWSWRKISKVMVWLQKINVQSVISFCVHFIYFSDFGYGNFIIIVIIELHCTVSVEWMMAVYRFRLYGTNNSNWIKYFLPIFGKLTRLNRAYAKWKLF